MYQYVCEYILIEIGLGYAVDALVGQIVHICSLANFHGVHLSAADQQLLSSGQTKKTFHTLILFASLIFSEA